MSDSSMSSSADFEIWNHNDRGGLSDTFTGTQGQDNITGNTDSLETAANTWVIVFNDTHYTGDSMQVGPGTYLSDLNHVDRYDSSGSKQGDWKNQIQSFILYKSQPAYWGRNPKSSELFDPGSGKAVFTENTDFLGDNRTFAAPYTAPNLQSIGYTTNSVEMYRTTGGTINSLRTGANAWLIISSDFESNGDSLKVPPSTTYKDLNDVDRKDMDGNDDGDWKNQIASFLLYPAKPAFWDTAYPRPYIDFAALFDLYPDTTNSVNDDKITYVIEDATYNIDEPDLEIQTTTQALSNYYGDDDFTPLPADGWTKYSVSMSHKNTAGRNDHANFNIYFDNTGKLVSIQDFTWDSDGAYNISQQAISIVDDEAWLLGASGTLETLGISDEIADAFVDMFDFVCKVFNDISSLIFKLTDNGGRYYFLPVICHTINRICTVVLDNYNLQTYTSAADTRNNYALDFNYGGYYNALSGSMDSISNWNTKSGYDANNAYNQVMEYVYSGYNFRTWYQEISFSVELGLMVSCKIDYEIDDDKDDHIILLMAFRVPAEGDTNPVLVFAQATIQFTDESESNIMTSPYTGDNIINDVYSDLSAGLSNDNVTTSEYGGRQYLADIAKANMQAMESCAVFEQK